MLQCVLPALLAWVSLPSASPNLPFGAEFSRGGPTATTVRGPGPRSGVMNTISVNITVDFTNTVPRNGRRRDTAADGLTRNHAAAGTPPHAATTTSQVSFAEQHLTAGASCADCHDGWRRPPAADARHTRATSVPDGGAGCPGTAPPPEEEARGRFKSSPPWCGAPTVLRTSSDKTAAAPAGRRSGAPCDRRRHPRYALANHRTSAPPCPESALPAEQPQSVWPRISPQCLCIVLSTVQLSAHGAHPTPCTIRGRAG